jgi:uncharacterized protein YjaG (DUF416 family)
LADVLTVTALYWETLTISEESLAYEYQIESLRSVVSTSASVGRFSEVWGATGVEAGWA